MGWPSLVAMQIDWTISVSDILAAISMIVSTWGAVFLLWHRIDRRVGAAEQTLANEVLPTIKEHTEAMKRHDQKINDALTQVALLMGRLNPVHWLDPERFPR